MMWSKPDQMAVSVNDSSSTIAADRVADVIAHDRADRGAANDADDREVLPGGAGIDSGQNQSRLAGERDAARFDGDEKTDDRITDGVDQAGDGGVGQPENGEQAGVPQLLLNISLRHCFGGPNGVQQCLLAQALCPSAAR